jgi:two-component sensor histidine kinase
LRRELNHRVKNILASVLSIFEMTRRAATAEGLATEFRGRPTALANVHAAVTLEGGEEISLADIAASTLAPYVNVRSAPPCSTRR